MVTILILASRSPRSLVRTATFLALGLAMAAGFLPLCAMAQGQACTYETCALRVRHRLFSQDIVQGVEEEKVATIGIFAPRIVVFAERSDSAQVHYGSFRSAHSASFWVTLGAVASLAASVIARENSEDGVAIGFLAVGAGLTAGATILSVKSRDHLSTAIWWYNRELMR